MEDLKVVFASNLIKLRTGANLTQLELAKKINYSDKSISKWERAEAIPDVLVVKQLAELFGVSVDFLLSKHDEFKIQPKRKEFGFNTTMVILISLIGIWTLAALVFIILWIVGIKVWMVFIAAVPVSLIDLLVLNTLWNEKKYNLIIVAGIVLSVFCVIYVSLIKFNPWQLVFIIGPAEIIVFLSFQVKRKSPQNKSKK